MKAREWALLVVNEVIQNGAYANIALDKQHQKKFLDGQERSLAVELSRGTIKAWGTLDWMIGFYLKYSLTDLPPIIGDILRIGFYQIFFMPKIPKSAACNESVELAKKYGHLGTVKLVNAVLRSAVRNPEKIIWPEKEKEPVKYLARKHYHPIWVTKRWYEELKFDETEKLLEQNNQAPSLGIRVQTLRNTPQACLEKLEKEGFHLQLSKLVPEGLRVLSHPALNYSQVLKNGEALIQDEGAMLIAHLLEPQPGEKILDACAAPGVKSTHLAELMKDNGTIIAQDIHDHKLNLIRQNAAKLQLKSIETHLGDARKVNYSKPEYDRILVDAPCSGLGTIGRRADTRWRKSEQQIKELTEIQFQILNSVSYGLKFGGRLVYSTCTLTPEENEKLISRFLESHSEFLVIPVEKILSNFTGKYLKLWPQETQTDGFFAAVLQKKGESK